MPLQQEGFNSLSGGLQSGDSLRSEGRAQSGRSMDYASAWNQGLGGPSDGYRSRAPDPRHVTHGGGQLNQYDALSAQEKLAQIALQRLNRDTAKSNVEEIKSVESVGLPKCLSKVSTHTAGIFTLLAHFPSGKGGDFLNVGWDNSRSVVVARALESDEKYEDGDTRLVFAITPTLVGLALNGLVGHWRLSWFKPLTPEENEVHQNKRSSDPKWLQTAFASSAAAVKVPTPKLLEECPTPSSIEQFKLWADGWILWVRMFYGEVPASLFLKLVGALSDMSYGKMLGALGVPVQFTMSQISNCWHKAAQDVVAQAEVDLSYLLDGMKRTQFHEQQLNTVTGVAQSVYTVASQKEYTSPFKCVDPENVDGTFQSFRRGVIKAQSASLMNIVTTRQGELDGGSSPSKKPKKGSVKGKVHFKPEVPKSYSEVPPRRLASLLAGLTSEVKDWIRGVPLTRLSSGVHCCADFHSRKGCGRYVCKFEHKGKLKKEEVSTQALAALISTHGGLSTEPEFKDNQAMVDEIKRLNSVKPSSSARGAVLQKKNMTPVAFADLPTQFQPEEFQLRQALEAEQSHDGKFDVSKLWAGMLPMDSQPVREVEMTGDRTEFALLEEDIVRSLVSRFPTLVEDLGEHAAHVFAVCTHAFMDSRGDGIQLSPEQLLMAGLEKLNESVVSGASATAQALWPPGQSARGPAEGKVRIRSAIEDVPIVRLGKSEPPAPNGTGLGTVEFLGESVGVLDLGESIGDNRGCCTLLSLSFLAGVSGQELIKTMQLDAKAAGQFIHRSSVCQTELEVMRLSHELFHVERGSHDVHLCRYFGGVYFRGLRIIVVMADKSAGPAEVQVFQHASWSSQDRNCSTHMMFMLEGHARPVVKMPASCGNEVCVSKKKSSYGKAKGISHHRAAAFLSKCRDHGVVPSIVLHIEPPDYRKEMGLGHEVREWSRDQLSPCSICGACVFLKPPATVARGYAIGHLAGNEIIKVTQSHLIQGLTHEPSAAQGKSSSLFPSALLQWAQHVQDRGGITAETLRKACPERSEEYLKWVGTNTASLKEMSFPAGAVRLARLIQQETELGLAEINRKEVQDKVPEVVERLTALLVSTKQLTRKLVKEMKGSARDSLAVFRQVKVVDGKLPLSEEGINSIRDLLPNSVVEVLKGLAAYGVPLFDRDEVVGPEESLRPPSKSADLKKFDIVYGALLDVSKGNGLIFDSSVNTEGMKFYPLACVPKKKSLPDGNQRMISAMVYTNARLFSSQAERVAEGGFKEPPAVCPRIEDILRLIIMYSILYGGVHIFMFKKDFESAFKLLWTTLADAFSQCTVLPELPGGGGRSILVLSVLVFGFQHSPGWFGVMAWSAVAAWGSLGAHRPSFNGSGTFKGSIHVDDHVGVVPGLGDRPQIAAIAYDQVAARGVAGAEAINPIKDKEEGSPALVATFWGFTVDVSRVRLEGPLAATFGISRDKLIDMLNYLSMEFLESVARRDLMMDVHQRITGLSVWFMRVSKSTRVIVADLFAMHASRSETKLDPWGTRREVNSLWLRYSESLELLRIVCRDVLRFEASVTACIACALSPAEQIRLGFPRLMLGSDATLGVISAIVYGEVTKVWAAHDVRKMMEVWKVNRRDIGVESRIAEYEMLPVVLMAMRFGHQWRGKLVIAAVDNVEAVQTINLKPVRAAKMRFMQAVLVKLSIKHGFELTSRYVASLNNVAADWLSREFLKATDEEMQQYMEDIEPGAVRMSLESEVSELLQLQGEGPSAVNSFALLEEAEDSPETKDARSRLEALRQAVWEQEEREEEEESLVSSMLPPLLFTAVVMHAGIGQIPAAIDKEGGRCVLVVERAAGLGKIAKSRVEGNSPDCEVKDRWDGEADQVKVDMVLIDSFFAFHHDLSDVTEEVGAVVSRLEPSQVVWVLRSAMVMKEEEVQRVDAAMRSVGFSRVSWSGAQSPTEVEMVDAGSVNGGIECRRGILHYEKVGDVEECPILAPLVPAWRRKETMEKSIVDSLEEVDKVPPECWVSGVLESGPYQDKGEWDVTLAGWMRLQDEELRKTVRLPVIDMSSHRSAAPRAWNLGMAGVGGVLIKDSRRSEYKDGTLVRRLMVEEVARLQGIPVEVVGRAREIRANAEFWVGSAVSSEIAGSIVGRCKSRLGLTKVIGGETPPPDQRRFVPPQTWARGGPCRVRMSSEFAGRPIGELTNLLVTNSLRYTSSKTYSSSFSHWRIWRWCRQHELFLKGEPTDEEELMEFVAHRGLVAGYAHGTVHVMLNALRFEHLRERYPDPLLGKDLLKVVMRGLKRMQGGVVRKIPVTVDLLKVIVKGLNLKCWDELVAASAIMFMYLFLLRSREALRKDGTDEQQCVRVCMITFFREGEEVEGDDILRADEVVLLSAYSKTDPNGQGGVHNIYEAPDSDLCVVKLLKQMYAIRPHHFSHPTNFLFTCDDGKVLHRDVVHRILEKAGEDMGLPEKALAVISLRAGGASSMYDAGFSVEEIKKRGKWASECWKVYVWEGRGRTRDLASRMLSSSVSMMASLAYYNRHAQDG